MDLKNLFTWMDTKDALYKGGVLLVWLLGILTTLGIIGGIIMLTRDTNNDESMNTITVTGTAEMFAVPDIAMISFSVQEEHKDLTTAQNQVTAVMNPALEKLTALGIAEKDIATENYSSNPRYEYDPKTGKRIFVGYEVMHSVQVKVRDLSTVGNVLGSLGGFALDSINGPSFMIDDPEMLQENLRAQAIKDGEDEAKRLVKELGVRLGKLVSYSEGGGYLSYAKAEMTTMSAMDNSAGAMIPEVPTGEQKLESQVTLTYRIR